MNDIQFPFHDPPVLALALTFIKDLHPYGIILNGDVVDAYSISDYDRNPLLHAGLQKEINLSRKLMDDLGACTERIWLGGNHEDRLRRYLWTHPEIADLEDLTFSKLFHVKEHGFTYYPYGKQWMLGRLMVTHGFMVRAHSGISAKAHFERLGTSVLIGHTHRLGIYYKTNVRGQHAAYENGCVLPGTVILRGINALPVEKFGSNQAYNLLNAEGYIVRSPERSTHHHNGDVIRLHVDGLWPLRLTPEHPVLTPSGYREAHKLRVGEFIVIPKYVPKEPLNMDVDLAWLLGMYLAEGSTSWDKNKPETGHVTWTLSDKENEYAAEICKQVARIGFHPTLKLPRKHTIEVCIYSSAAAKMFEGLAGKGAGTKQLAPHLLSLSPEASLALIRGWLAGDGHYREAQGRYTGVTISYVLAWQLFTLAHRMGLRPNMRVQRRERKKDAFLLGWERRHEAEYLKVGGVVPTDRGTYGLLREIHRETYTGLVYNFLVPEGHSYIANGIGVHNCLCRLDPEYTQAPDWQQGLSVVTVRENGYFSVQQLPILGRKMLMYGRETYTL